MATGEHTTRRSPTRGATRRGAFPLPVLLIALLPPAAGSVIGCSPIGSLRYLSPEGHRERARELMTRDRPDFGSAIRHFALALNEEPDDRATLLGQAKCYRRIGKHRSACVALAKAKDLAPDDERARLMLADSLAEDGRVDEAKAELREYLVTNPASAYAKNLLAFLLAEFGRSGDDLEEACTLAREAYDASPAQPAFMDTLGWALYKTGDVQEARELLEQAVLAPRDPWPFYHLAVVVEDGEPDVARVNIHMASRLMDRMMSRGHISTRLRRQVASMCRKLGMR